eukprot:1186258-Prorocentrum_minimum.AAC.3
MRGCHVASAGMWTGQKISFGAMGDSFFEYLIKVSASFRSGLDTDTAKLTVKTLLSHLVTREFNHPANFLRTPYVRVEPCPSVGLHMAMKPSTSGSTTGKFHENSPSFVRAPRVLVKFQPPFLPSFFVRLVGASGICLGK